MADAGFSIPTDVVQKAEEVKTAQKKNFAIFKLDKTSVQYVRSFPDSEDELKAFTADAKTREENWKSRVYDSFFAALKEEKEPCWAVVDFRAVLDDGRKITKVILVGWSPDKAGVKLKMTFASTHKKFADTLNISKRIEAHVAADITYEELLEKAKS